MKNPLLSWDQQLLAIGRFLFVHGSLLYIRRKKGRGGRARRSVHLNTAYGEYFFDCTHHLTVIYDLRNAWNGMRASFSVIWNNLSLAAGRFMTLLPIVSYLI